MWELDYKESWVPKNWCLWTVVLEKTLETPLDSEEIKPVNPKKKKSTLNTHWKDWCWSWSSNTLATRCEQLTYWKDPDAGKDWKQEDVGDRGWDSWMASPIQWMWTWANSRGWWGTGKLGMLPSTELQRAGHDLATEQQQQQPLLISVSNL